MPVLWDLLFVMVVDRDQRLRYEDDGHVTVVAESEVRWPRHAHHQGPPDRLDGDDAIRIGGVIEDERV